MPRDTLSVEQIVGAAIELLDDEGLDGLNMRALGNRLGSAATAIYWHIRTKDELVQLAADALWAEVELPDLENWREAATAMATGLHAMLARHPWLGQAFGSHLLSGPGKFRYDDRSLAIYVQAGFSPDDADRAAGTVLVFVIGNALGAAAQVSLNHRLSRGARNAEQTIQESQEQATHLGTRGETTAHSTFTFGLNAILDGFEAQLRS